MCRVVQTKPAFYGAFLASALLLMMLINFSPLVQTAKRILRRG
jgi:hypothetical protein